MKYLVIERAVLERYDVGPYVRRSVKLIDGGEPIKIEISETIKVEVIHAFLGCFITQLKALGFSHGAASDVIHSLLTYFICNVKFDPDEMEEPINKISNLYELMDWSMKGVYDDNNNIRLADDTYRVMVFGWPKYDKRCTEKNKMLLATSYNRSKQEAKYDAALKALKVLEEMGIYKPPINFFGMK